MPLTKLPYPEKGETDKETVQNVYDTTIRLRKELEFLLGHLDDDNIASLDVEKIDGLNLKVQSLIADFVMADVVISNTVITQNLYAQEGQISRLTVDKLLTRQILDGNPYMYYIEIQGEYIKFIQANRRDDLAQVQYTDQANAPLYWTDETHQLMSTEVSLYPVMVYQYDKFEKLKIYFDSSTPKVPIIEMGAGDGVLPTSAKGYIKKTATGIMLDYHKSNTATSVSLELNDTGLWLNGTGFVKCTAAEYAALTPNASTLYFISG